MGCADRRLGHLWKLVPQRSEFRRSESPSRKGGPSETYRRGPAATNDRSEVDRWITVFTENNLPAFLRAWSRSLGRFDPAEMGRLVPLSVLVRNAQGTRDKTKDEADYKLLNEFIRLAAEVDPASSAQARDATTSSNDGSDYSLKLSGAYSASESRIEFGVLLTNDTQRIVRDVVVQAFLDSEEVARSGPVDVLPQARAVDLFVALKRPEDADLVPKRNNEPTFHGKTFSVAARFGEIVVHAEWPTSD
jgi:hypothetical protein